MRSAPTLLSFALLLLSGFASLAQDPTVRLGDQIPPEVGTIYEKGLAWLASAQSTDGTWNDNHQGCGVDGICLMAFLASGDDPNFGKYAPIIRRSIRAIIRRQDTNSGYMPDTMYQHGFAMLALSEAYGVVDETLLWEGEKPMRSIARTLELGIQCAATSQKKNKMGGWRYSANSTDADTSVAGAVIMGLLAARNAGMNVPDETVNAALEYLRRSTGKDGSVAYTGGLAGLGGSMNLTAIVALVGAVAKFKEDASYQAAINRLGENLESKDSNYIEYFRYYTAQALFQGNYPGWVKWNAGLARELNNSQAADGSFANGAYGTAMTLLALGVNYRFLPIYER